MFKLRFYITHGFAEGYLDHEEYFDTFAEARERYDEVWERELFTLNPTMWEATDDNRTDWTRVLGF